MLETVPRLPLLSADLDNRDMLFSKRGGKLVRSYLHSYNVYRDILRILLRAVLDVK
jgi:hypothetical protein